MPRRNNVTTENRRVKYSKKLIQDSLLQLLQEKPLEKITVKAEKLAACEGTITVSLEEK